VDDVGVNRSHPKSPNLSDVINDVLPQTQCTRCGYPACRLYAQAIAQGQANINQCPPGGDAGIRRLAELTGKPYVPLNPAHGQEKPRERVIIDESRCIGCTLCIRACPVDAIVGGFKAMHTVLIDTCTGCELCIAPCPVDCITLAPCIGSAEWPPHAAQTARIRYEARQERLHQESMAATRTAPNADRLASVLAKARARAAQRRP